MGFTTEQFASIQNSIPKLFHRTFASDRTEIEDVKKSDWRKPNPAQLERMTQPPRSPSTHSFAVREVKPMLRNAYYTDGKSLTPTRIWAREGQQFSLYATEWERQWSSLLNDRYNSFLPIVDEFDTVIGHHGRITSDKILSNQIPSGFIGHDFVSLFDNYDLLVGNGEVEAKQGYRRALNTFSYYTVQTDIDGNITSGVYSGAMNNGEAIPSEFTPSDIASGVKLLFSAATIVVRLGSRSMRTIARRIAAKRLTQALKREFKLKYGYDPRMGIPSEHLDAMIAACKEADVIAIFRANKSAAIPLIRQGAHGKPMWAKFKTSAKTGVLTATEKEHQLLAYQNGAFVIHPDTVASRKAIRITKSSNGELIRETTTLKGDWTVEPWQVVGKDGRPFVGDYDLLGVAPIRSTGSNVSLVPDNVITGDWTGPWVEKYRTAINRKLDKPRVLHGAQDSYGGTVEYRGLTDDTAYAVYPNGGIVVLEGRAEQEAFYASIRREAKSKAPAPIGDPNFKLHIVK